MILRQTLATNWDKISAPCKEEIHREIRKAIKSGNAGMQMDVENWQTVLNWGIE